MGALVTYSRHELPSMLIIFWLEIEHPVTESVVVRLKGISLVYIVLCFETMCLASVPLMVGN